MNIKGIRRSLSLSQPPIDPMLLVRARAAGLFDPVMGRSGSHCAICGFLRRFFHPLQTIRQSDALPVEVVNEATVR
jgi:hypothetical protein